MLDAVGVVPEDERPFVLADGREVRYPVAWAQMRIGGREQPTIVVFGTPRSEPILGVVTLEEFLLAADPVQRRLVPVPGLLKGAGSSSLRCEATFRSPPSRTAPCSLLPQGPGAEVFVPVKDSTDHVNYVQIFGAVAQILVSMVGILVLVKK